MKKIVLAGLTVAAVAATSFAADVKISGSYDLRGFALDNTDFNANDDNGTDARFYDQRVRVQAVMKASDAISVTLRSDLSEGDWGTNDTQSNNGGNKFRLDRAFLTMKLPSNLGTLTAGTIGYDIERTGLLLNLHRNDGFLYTNTFGMVGVEAGNIKVEDSELNVGVTAEGDRDVYLVKATVKPMDNLTVSPYFVYDNDKDEALGANVKRMALGVDAGFKAGMFGVDGTLYMIDGKEETPGAVDKDLEGLVFNLMANVKPIPGLTIGAGYTYMQGDDNAADNENEAIVSFVDGDPGNNPMRGFIFWNDYSHDGAKLYGTDGKNVSQPASGYFNGINAFKLYADYAFDKFGVGAHAIYAEDAETVTGANEKEITEFGVYGSYKIYDNATLTLQLATAELDEANTQRDDATFAGLGLSVKF
ncbi:porin [Chrysiogenes arsenatis]|uniref:porin n=1 Tax=Chrysiogenes arsenatis TaxID=309797 RepID=UPI0004219092|nr:hypothetical protein [Chrysiogenes arsenatis]